jgi:polysaccharide biosynthesis protein PslG
VPDTGGTRLAPDGGFQGVQGFRVRNRRARLGRLAAALAGSIVLVAAAAAALPASAGAAQLRGAVLTPNFHLPPPNGVTVAQSDHEVAATCGLGATVARVVVNWDVLEPGPGQIDPAYAARVARMINGLARCGIPTELTLLGTPCWLTSDPRATRFSCPSTAWRYPPRSLSAFGDIVSWMLVQWGSSLAALEIWNEPNSPGFWLGSVQDYVSLVNEATDRAGALGSQVPVLAGALAGADAAYLRGMYAAGMRGQSGISMHPYTLCVTASAFVSPARASCRRAKAPKRSGRKSIFRSGIAKVHRAMVAAGDTGGLWLTEFGFPVCPATPYCVPRRTQARWIATSFRLAASIRYVRAAIVFSVRDIGNTLDWNHRFGLLTRDFRPRPSYLAVRRIFKHRARLHRAKQKQRRHHRG